MNTTSRIHPLRRAWLPLLALAMLALPNPAEAAPKKSSTGENCTSTGTSRRDGKDAATGEKLNCLFDYCTYCSTSGGQIDCSKMITEYTNARDCKAARAGIGSRPDVAAPGGGVLDPGTGNRTKNPANKLPGTLQKMQ